MANPFTVVQAGIFATLPPLPGEISMAALICAALARRLASPPAKTGLLDRAWWSEAFNSVPLLSPSATVTGSVASPSPANMAALCLGTGVTADAPGGRDALADWISAISPQPVMLNSIAVTEAGDLIHLSLAFVDAVAGNFARTEAVIDASAANTGNLQSVFGAVQPLTTQPYYCSLRSGG